MNCWSQDQSFEDFKETKGNSKEKASKSKSKVKSRPVKSSKGAVKPKHGSSVTSCPVGNRNMESEKLNDDVCLEKDGHSDPQLNENDANSQQEKNQFLCFVCQKNISYLSNSNREQHVNNCLNKQEAEEKWKTIGLNGKRIQETENIILDCPLCGQSFQSSDSRQVHLKNCSNRMNMNTKQLIEAVRLQEKHAKERVAAGLPVVTSRVSKLPKESRRSKSLKQPKSKREEDLQIALALSASLMEKNKEQIPSKEQTIDELFSCQDVKHVENKNTSEKSFFHTMKIEWVNCKTVKKKKINKTQTMPVLKLRTDEERKKILEERVSKLFMSELSDYDLLIKKSFCNEDTKSVESADKLDRVYRFATEGCPLWKASSTDNVPSDQFYVSSLNDMVSPNKVKPGSKLRRLSQVAGSSLSFNADAVCISDSNQDEVLPSTQKLIDFVLDDNDVCSNQNDYIDSKYDSNCGFCLDERKDCENGNLKMKETHQDLKPVMKLSSCFKSIVGSSDYSDLSIIVADNKIIPAHSLILNIRCPVISKSYKEIKGKLQLDWSDICYSTAIAFLEVIYSGNTDMNNIRRKDQLRKLIYRYGVENLFEDFDVMLDTDVNQQNFIESEEQKLNNVLDGIWKVGNRNNNQQNLKSNIKSNDTSDDMDDVYEYLTQKINKSKDLEDSNCHKVETRNSDEYKCRSSTPIRPTTRNISNSNEENDGNLLNQEHADNMQITKLDLPILSHEGENNFELHSDTIEDAVEKNKKYTNLKEHIDAIHLQNNFQFPVEACSSKQSNLSITTDMAISTSDSSDNENINYAFCEIDSPELFVNISGSEIEDPNLFHDCENVKQNLSNFEDPVVNLLEGNDDNSVVVNTTNADKSTCIEKSENGKRNLKRRREFSETEQHHSRKSTKSEDQKNSSRNSSMMTDESNKKEQNINSVSLSDNHNNSYYDHVWDDFPDDDFDVFSSQCNYDDDCNNENNKISDQLIETPKIAPEATFRDVIKENETTPCCSEFNDGSENNSLPIPVCWTEEGKKDSKSKATENTTKLKRPDNSVTPMPNYYNMITPELKEYCKKYGIKRLNRKKAVAILTHIYNETHPWVTDSEASMLSNSSMETPIFNRKRTSDENFKVSPLKEEDIRDKTTKCNSRRTKLKSRINLLEKMSLDKRKSKKYTKLKKATTETNSASQTELATELEKSSQSSSQSEKSDVLEESLFISQQQPTEADVQKKLRLFIQDNPEIYEKILTYEPQNIIEFQKKVKAAGIKASMRNLMDFFDEECITFVLPRGEKDKERQMKRTLRYRNKVKERLAKEKLNSQQ